MVTLEAKIKQSAKQKEKNDETLRTASNWGYLWDSSEIDFLTRNAGKIKPEEIAVKIGRSYHGLCKKAEQLGVSLQTNHHNGNGSRPSVSTQKETKRLRKVHKVACVPVYKKGVVSGYRKREFTYYEEY